MQTQDDVVVVRPQVSRRALTRGLAWAAPAVAVAMPSPAYAISCHAFTTTQSVVWTPNPDGGNNTTNSGTAGGVTVGVTTAYPGSRGGRHPNMNMTTTPTSSTAPTEFIIANTTPGIAGGNNYQEVTFTFSQPVWDLSFTLRDVDRTGTTYFDHVAISSVTSATGSTATFTGTRGSLVTGTGTLAAPWMPSQNFNGKYDPRQEVKVAFTGPVTSFTLRYWSTINAYNDFMFISIAGMTYRVCTQN